jgi:hypothetical protein
LGASPILNDDGTYTIVHGGGLTSSSIYDPIKNTMITGPLLSTAANCGFFAVPLVGTNAGSYRTSVGTASSTIGSTGSMMYNSKTKIFSNATALGAVVGCGGYAFQRQDGMWVTVPGAGGTAGAASNATGIINPWSNSVGAGPTLTTAVGMGSRVIPRADGTFLITVGNELTTTNIYAPWGGSPAVAAATQIGVALGNGPTLVNAAGRGSVMFFRPDGKIVIINGGLVPSTNVNMYDAGWYAEGQYRSEMLNVPNLTPNSTMQWKRSADNYVSFEVRTASSQAALQAAAYEDIPQSGGNIGASVGDAWVQVQMNFSRDFPGYSGISQDVYNSTGNSLFPYSNILTPQVYSFSIGEDNDLITLQSGGSNVFRVTESGSVYSSSQGGFFSGGADLAERYTSTDSLQPGEVVTNDLINSQGVLRSKGQYQQQLIGVVSTNPGFVAGAYTENSYPIALVGRVPVKVSTENGNIKAGDYLTSASIPGYAMKATQAGRVLGQVMEDLTPDKITSCPSVGLGMLPRTKCGTVMVFVNLTNYLGAPVEASMLDYYKNKLVYLKDTTAEDSATSTLEELDLNNLPVTINPPGSELRQAQILSYLSELRNNQNSENSPLTEVLAQRINAISEIISPQVIADLVKANALTINSISTQSLSAASGTIESLFVSEINSNEDSDINLNLSSGSEFNIFAKATDTGLSNLVLNLDIEGNAQFAGNVLGANIVKMQDDLEDIKQTLDNLDVQPNPLSEVLTVNEDGSLLVSGGLEVLGQTILHDGLVVDYIGQEDGLLGLMGDVLYFGRPYFNSDTAGFAEIKTGQNMVDVEFEREYLDQPIVNTSISINTSTPNSQMSNTEIAQQIFDSDIRFVVINKSEKGFTIMLNKPAPFEINFSWIALAVNGAKTFTSKQPALTPVIETPVIKNEPVIDASSSPDILPKVDVLEPVITKPDSEISVTSTSLTSKKEIEDSSSVLPPVEIEQKPEDKTQQNTATNTTELSQ